MAVGVEGVGFHFELSVDFGQIQLLQDLHLGMLSTSRATEGKLPVY